jgi:hypothetical protein
MALIEGGEDALVHRHGEKYARRRRQVPSKQNQTTTLSALTTLTRCLRKYVENNPSRFRIVEKVGKSRRICTVILRSSVEPS